MVVNMLEHDGLNSDLLSFRNGTGGLNQAKGLALIVLIIVADSLTIRPHEKQHSDTVVMSLTSEVMASAPGKNSSVLKQAWQMTSLCQTKNRIQMKSLSSILMDIALWPSTWLVFSVTVVILRICEACCLKMGLLTVSFDYKSFVHFLILSRGLESFSRSKTGFILSCWVLAEQYWLSLQRQSTYLRLRNA